jgi:hypothetical protein
MKNEVWNGYVYEHLVIAEKYLGRSIRSDEVVHHLDGNRSNNRHENLLVLERSQHAKLHEWLRKSDPFLKKNGEKGKNSGKPKSCKFCGKTLQDKQKDCCSVDCSGKTRRKPRPDKETLQKEIKKESFLSLGRKYGVSDNAVRKWARQYSLSW